MVQIEMEIWVDGVRFRMLMIGLTVEELTFEPPQRRNPQGDGSVRLLLLHTIEHNRGVYDYSPLTYRHQSLLVT